MDLLVFFPLVEFRENRIAVFTIVYVFFVV